MAVYVSRRNMLTGAFPLLEFAVQEAQADARGAGQGQGGQDGVDPDVVDDYLVVHQPAVRVDHPVRAVPLTFAQHDGGGRAGRGGGRLHRRVPGRRFNTDARAFPADPSPRRTCEHTRQGHSSNV